MRVIGIVLLLAGLAGMGLAFGFPVSIAPDAIATHDALMAQLQTGVAASLPDNIANIDLIAVRAMLNASAGFVAVCGAILTACGTRQNAAEPVAAGGVGGTIGL